MKSRMRLLRGSSLPYKRVAAMLSVLGAALESSRPMLIQLTFGLQQAEGSELKMMRTNVLRYLVDRVTAAPASVLQLAMVDPLLSVPELAALNRGLFEAAVNLLYLVSSEETDVRYVSFFAHAFREERKMYESMDKWTTYHDDFISTRAKAQLTVEEPPDDDVLDAVIKAFGLTGKQIPKYPSIHARCREIGPRWEFFYDAKYRGLSAWQHGDPSRATVTSSLLLHIPDMRERSVFESLAMVVWAWEITRELGHALARMVKAEEAVRVFSQMDAACQRAAASVMHDAAMKFHGPGVFIVDEEAPLS